MLETVTLGSFNAIANDVPMQARLEYESQVGYVTAIEYKTVVIVLWRVIYISIFFYANDQTVKLILF